MVLMSKQTKESNYKRKRNSHKQKKCFVISFKLNYVLLPATRLILHDFNGVWNSFTRAQQHDGHSFLAIIKWRAKIWNDFLNERFE